MRKRRDQTGAFKTEPSKRRQRSNMRPEQFSAELRRHLVAELAKPCGKNANKTKFQVLSETLVNLAIEGGKDAIHILLDRLAGRVPQGTSGAEESGPAIVEYVIEAPRPYHDPPTQSPETGTELPGVSAPDGIP